MFDLAIFALSMRLLAVTVFAKVRPRNILSGCPDRFIKFFVTEHFTLGQMHRLKEFGSDHFPIMATLCYHPSRSDENHKRG
jgi:hypothetical protein